MRYTFVTFMQLPKVNNYLLGGNSPNLVTLSPCSTLIGVDKYMYLTKTCKNCYAKEQTIAFLSFKL
jgi:hypothetical protein